MQKWREFSEGFYSCQGEKKGCDSNNVLDSRKWKKTRSNSGPGKTEWLVIIQKTEHNISQNFSKNSNWWYQVFLELGKKWHWKQKSCLQVNLKRSLTSFPSTFHVATPMDPLESRQRSRTVQSTTGLNQSLYSKSWKPLSPPSHLLPLGLYSLQAASYRSLLNGKRVRLKRLILEVPQTNAWQDSPIAKATSNEVPCSCTAIYWLFKQLFTDLKVFEEITNLTSEAKTTNRKINVEGKKKVRNENFISSRI